MHTGYGYRPYFVEGDDPPRMHRLMAAALDAVFDAVRDIQDDARANGFRERAMWPMIVLRTPKGWTGPKEVDGQPTENSWRSHQVPFADMAKKPAHLDLLRQWLESYKAEELFDEQGSLRGEIAELAPEDDRRMGANPHANGGLLLRDLRMPDFRDYAIEVTSPGTEMGEATRVAGVFLRDIIKQNHPST